MFFIHFAVLVYETCCHSFDASTIDTALSARFQFRKNVEWHYFRLPPLCKWDPRTYGMMPTFRHHLFVPSSSVQQSNNSCLDCPGRWYQEVLSETSLSSYQFTLRNIAEECRSQCTQTLSVRMQWKRNLVFDILLFKSHWSHSHGKIPYLVQYHFKYSMTMRLLGCYMRQFLVWRTLFFIHFFF